jgi:Flp pilus assembly protein TadG
MNTPAPLARFRSDRRGNVAVLFALAMIPLTFAAGAAVDYSRAGDVQSRLQMAADSAALAGARGGRTLPQTEFDDRTRGTFDSALGLTDREGAVTSFRAVREGSLVKIEATVEVNLAFASVLKRDGLDVSTKATANMSSKPVEIALVLDNTGSMADAGKMAALKTSAKNLIDYLDGIVDDRNNAKVALVPFATQVNIGTANKSASWLYYDTQGSSLGSKVTSTNWKGCITDRKQPYDAQLPTFLTGDGQYWADLCDSSKSDGSPALAPVMALTTDYSALRTAIDGLNPTGNTNVGIGVAWGMEALTPGGPLGGTTLAVGDTTVDKVMIVLTDGLNTQNRWDKVVCFLIWCTGTDKIDARMSAACESAKTAGIKVYTVRVIDGNADLLKACASKDSFFYNVLKAEDLAPAFKAIGESIATIRIAS